MHEIEEKILENKSYFNDNEPDEGHELRFENRLNNSFDIASKKVIIPMYFKIAATFLVLVASAYLILKTVETPTLHDNVFINQIVYSQELGNIQTYYDEVSLVRLNQIDELASTGDEAKKLKSVAIKRMDKLDANLAKIEKEYVKNPDNEKLKAAIVNNKKMKVEVIDNIVDQLISAQQGYHAGSIFTNF